MLFIDNKYTSWYNQIIESAKQNPNTGYIERHHIIPRCMNGSNDPENIVPLTARQHFICHMLLVKMVSDSTHKTKLVYAAILLSSVSGFHITSRLYEKMKSSIVITDEEREKRSLRMKEAYANNPMLRKSKGDANRGKRMSIEQRQRLSEINSGKTIPEETRSKISDTMRGYVQAPDHIAARFKSRAGYIHSDETKQKISKSAKERDTIYKTCHCGKTVDSMNYAQWHGDNCGKVVTVTDETKAKISKANKGRVRELKHCEHCDKQTDLGNYKRWHGANCKHKRNYDEDNNNRPQG